MSEVNDNNATQELAPSEPVQKTPSPTPGTSTQTPPPVLLTTPEIPANERNSNDFIMKPHTSSVTAVPLLSPQDIRPFPKAPEKKTVLNKRKRKSAILTDTPIKNELAEQQKMRKLKPKIPKKKKVQGKKKKSNRLAAAKRMNLKTFFV